MGRKEAGDLLEFSTAKGTRFLGAHHHPEKAVGMISLPLPYAISHIDTPK